MLTSASAQTVPRASQRSLPAAAGQSTTRYCERPSAQRRRDARIHDEKALPAVEKRDALAPGLPQIHVRASRLRVTSGELAERERAGENQRAAREPEPERQRGRAERADQLRGRQKDSDADRVADDERRRR